MLLRHLFGTVKQSNSIGLTVQIKINIINCVAAAQQDLRQNFADCGNGGVLWQRITIFETYLAVIQTVQARA